METEKTVNIIGLDSIGLITWIVFMIMDYGCHMDWIVNANTAIRDGGHFWTWFPLWAPAALGVGLFIIIVIFSLIFGLASDR